MPQHTRPLVPVLLAALVLVGGANVAAYAANGHPILIGEGNNGTRVTTLDNTGDGPALSLRSDGNGPSLKVTGTGRVANLNSDRVDGRHAGDLLNRTWVYTLPEQDDSPSFVVDFPGLPNGRYLATYDIHVTLASTANLKCQLQDGLSRSIGVSGNFNSEISGVSGAIVIESDGLHELWCNVLTGTFDLDPDSTVTFTRLDTVTTQVAGTVNTRPSHAQRH